MSTKQEEKYKKRHDRLVQQIVTLYGKPLNTAQAYVQFSAYTFQNSVAYGYSVKIRTGSEDWETVMSVRRDVGYVEDVVSVIGQEVRRLLRDRIYNARKALR